MSNTNNIANDLGNRNMATAKVCHVGDKSKKAQVVVLSYKAESIYPFYATDSYGFYVAASDSLPKMRKMLEGMIDPVIGTGHLEVRITEGCMLMIEGAK